MGKMGMVLEGGGLRGIFTAGVIDVLLQNDVRLDGLVGVSAGACFGCNYPSKHVSRALRYNLTYCKDRRYCSWWSFVRTGDLFGADFCYREVPLMLDPFDSKAFDESNVEFWVVCTDVNTGEPVYHLCPTVDNNTFEWIRASASMPLVSHPVECDGKQLLDGGIVDPIPLQFAEQCGYERNLVVLTQPRNYEKRPSKTMPLMRSTLRKQPAVARAMEVRPQVYNQEKAYVMERERADAAFVLCPDGPLSARRVEHDPHHITETYFAGVKVAERELGRLREWLAG